MPWCARQVLPTGPKRGKARRPAANAAGRRVKAHAFDAADKSSRPSKRRPASTAVAKQKHHEAQHAPRHPLDASPSPSPRAAGRTWTEAKGTKDHVGALLVDASHQAWSKEGEAAAYERALEAGRAMLVEAAAAAASPQKRGAASSCAQSVRDRGGREAFQGTHLHPDPASRPSCAGDFHKEEPDHFSPSAMRPSPMRQPTTVSGHGGGAGAGGVGGVRALTASSRPYGVERADAADRFETSTALAHSSCSSAVHEHVHAHTRGGSRTGGGGGGGGGAAPLAAWSAPDVDLRGSSGAFAPLGAFARRTADQTVGGHLGKGSYALVVATPAAAGFRRRDAAF